MQKAHPLLFILPMSSIEKFYSILAICYVTGLAIFLIVTPAAREFKYLLPLSLLGVGVNVGLLYVVFKDILSRSFTTSGAKFLWMIAVFIFMPAIVIYLPLHGFKKR